MLIATVLMEMPSSMICTLQIQWGLVSCSHPFGCTQEGICNGPIWQPDGEDAVLSCLALKNFLKSSMDSEREISWVTIFQSDGIHVCSDVDKCGSMLSTKEPSKSCSCEHLFGSRAEERVGSNIKGVFSDWRECFRLWNKMVCSASALELIVMWGDSYCLGQTAPPPGRDWVCWSL